MLFQTRRVSASAKIEALFTGTASKSYTISITLNNTAEAVDISFTLEAGTSNDDYSAAVNAFNAATSKTRVSEAWDEVNKGIKLVNSTEGNIALTDKNKTNGAKLAAYRYGTDNGTGIAQDTGAVQTAVALGKGGAAAARTVVGTVAFDSDSSFSVTSEDNVADMNSVLKRKFTGAFFWMRCPPNESKSIENNRLVGAERSDLQGWITLNSRAACC